MHPVVRAGHSGADKGRGRSQRLAIVSPIGGAVLFVGVFHVERDSLLHLVFAEQLQPIEPGDRIGQRQNNSRLSGSGSESATAGAYPETKIAEAGRPDRGGMNEISTPAKAVILLELETQPHGQRTVGTGSRAPPHRLEQRIIQLPVEGRGDYCSGTSCAICGGTAVMSGLVGAVILESGEEIPAGIFGGSPIGVEIG